jgi:hypothetical protein
MAPRVADETPDYLALADAAELRAAKAASPELADSWRQLAETYRHLAALLARAKATKTDATDPA